MRRLDELAQNGYCRLPTFLSPAEAAGWLQRLDECRGSFRAVGGKGGLGLPFHMMDGEQAMARLGDICAQLQPRLQEAAERVTGKRLEPIRDRRRALRIQRYRGRNEGFRWHFDGSHTTALLTLGNSNRGATEVVPASWTPLLKPLFYALYPLRDVFSLFPHVTLVAEPGELVILSGRAVLHRGAVGDGPGERVVLLAAFDPAGAKPRPIQDWIARRFNY